MIPCNKGTDTSEGAQQNSNTEQRVQYPQEKIVESPLPMCLNKDSQKQQRIIKKPKYLNDYVFGQTLSH